MFNGRTPVSYPSVLVIFAARPHGSHMRIAAVLVLVGGVWAAEPESGIWKMNPVRSTFSGDTQPRILIVRLEAHANGQVFTLDRIESDGRATSSSTILYFDGVARDFQQGECSNPRGVWILPGCRPVDAISMEPPPSADLPILSNA